MPTRAVAPSTRTHSWSFVYFKPLGYMWAPAPGSLRSFVERHRHDLRLDAASANIDLEAGARRRVVRRQVSHPDRLLEEGRLRAARHHAGLLSVDVDIVTMAGDRAVEHFETHQSARRPLGLLPFQYIGADELVLLPADDPAKVRLEDCRRLVHVVAVEAHRRFEPKGVARAEAGRHHAGGLSGGEDRVPYPVGGARRHENLVAVFAGVAGPRDRHTHVRHF